ncbi:hypothetical protein [Streptomyces sp. URMC 123]|uniref:hypothetical protein n=1 Tax=Streptomyces sp. URMC 123 TaxID=3423403 RepID=UPI003F1D59E5
MTTIDELLAGAAVPTSPSDSFDVAKALRRLAADATRAAPPPDMARAAEAGQRLAVVCRWILNRPDAAVHVRRLATDTDDTERGEEYLDVDGALVFACLLYLTGHPESAQFWWQLAAGAGNRAAAYCLHLHHLALGESREAQHWLHQVTHSALDSEAPDTEFLACLEAAALYVRRNGSAASPPTGRLEMEVDRLATGGPCIIVRPPDRRLADWLHDFIRRCRPAADPPRCPTPLPAGRGGHRTDPARRPRGEDRPPCPTVVNSRPAPRSAPACGASHAAAPAAAGEPRSPTCCAASATASARA